MAAMTEQETTDFLEEPEVAKLVEEYAARAANDWDVGYISKASLDDEDSPHRGGVFLADAHDDSHIVSSERDALARMKYLADGELKDLEEGHVQSDYRTRAKYAKVDSKGNVIYAHRSSDLEAWWEDYCGEALRDELGIEDEEKAEAFVNAVYHSPGVPLR